jgi:hypothetical protein
MPSKKRWVYILEEAIPYEGSHFHAAYSSRLKAERAKTALYGNWLNDGYGHRATLYIRQEEVL